MLSVNADPHDWQKWRARRVQGQQTATTSSKDSAVIEASSWADSLIGFRIDKRGRLIAESCAPKNGLTADEFQFYVRHLAIEADRFEYMLSGRDTH